MQTEPALCIVCGCSRVGAASQTSARLCAHRSACTPTPLLPARPLLPRSSTTPPPTPRACKSWTAGPGCSPASTAAGCAPSGRRRRRQQGQRLTNEHAAVQRLRDSAPSPWRTAFIGCPSSPHVVLRCCKWSVAVLHLYSRTGAEPEGRAEGKDRHESGDQEEASRAWAQVARHDTHTFIAGCCLGTGVGWGSACREGGGCQHGGRGTGAHGQTTDSLHTASSSSLWLAAEQTAPSRHTKAAGQAQKRQPHGCAAVAAAGLAGLAGAEPAGAARPWAATPPRIPLHSVPLLPRLAAAPPALLPAAASVLPVPAILPLPATGSAAAPPVAVIAAAAILLPVAAAAAAAPPRVALAGAAAAAPAVPPLPLPPEPLRLEGRRLLGCACALVCLGLLLLLRGRGHRLAGHGAASGAKAEGCAKERATWRAAAPWHACSAAMRAP